MASKMTPKQLMKYVQLCIDNDVDVDGGPDCFIHIDDEWDQPIGVNINGVYTHVTPDGRGHQ